MFRRFSNLGVLCVALAAAAGMLAWVSTIAINILLERPEESANAVSTVQPATDK